MATADTEHRNIQTDKPTEGTSFKQQEQEKLDESLENIKKKIKYNQKKTKLQRWEESPNKKNSSDTGLHKRNQKILNATVNTKMRQLKRIYKDVHKIEIKLKSKVFLKVDYITKKVLPFLITEGKDHNFARCQLISKTTNTDKWNLIDQRDTNLLFHQKESKSPSKQNSRRKISTRSKRRNISSGTTENNTNFLPIKTSSKKTGESKNSKKIAFHHR